MRENPPRRTCKMPLTRASPRESPVLPGLSKHAQGLKPVEKRDLSAAATGTVVIETVAVRREVVRRGEDMMIRDLVAAAEAGSMRDVIVPDLEPAAIVAEDAIARIRVVALTAEGAGPGQIAVLTVGEAAPGPIAEIDETASILDKRRDAMILIPPIPHHRHHHRHPPVPLLRKRKSIEGMTGRWIDRRRSPWIEPTCWNETGCCLEWRSNSE